MNNKLFFSAMAFLYFSFHVTGQPSLKIYINRQYWNGVEKISISPADTVEFRIENTDNTHYQFENIAFEIVLKEKILFVFNKEKNRWKHEVPRSQSDRIINGLILYPPNDYITNPQEVYNASANPTFVIPCNRFAKYELLSRVIVHVKGINKVTAENKSLMDLQSLGYRKEFFRDGFSFYRGKGFN